MARSVSRAAELNLQCCHQKRHSPLPVHSGNRTLNKEKEHRGGGHNTSEHKPDILPSTPLRFFFTSRRVTSPLPHHRKHSSHLTSHSSPQNKRTQRKKRHEGIAERPVMSLGHLNVILVITSLFFITVFRCVALSRRPQLQTFECPAAARYTRLVSYGPLAVSLLAKTPSSCVVVLVLPLVLSLSWFSHSSRNQVFPSPHRHWTKTVRICQPRFFFNSLMLSWCLFFVFFSSSGYSVTPPPHLVEFLHQLCSSVLFSFTVLFFFSCVLLAFFSALLFSLLLLLSQSFPGTSFSVSLFSNVICILQFCSLSLFFLSHFLLASFLLLLSPSSCSLFSHSPQRKLPRLTLTSTCYLLFLHFFSLPSVYSVRSCISSSRPSRRSFLILRNWLSDLPCRFMFALSLESGI